MIKKLLSNKSGFTLTEVLVGVLVLSMSIVATTNFLVSMIHSNVANTSSLKAYYYTQEAIEAFRNMRDTHFMHNVDFCGVDVNFWDVDGGFSKDCEGGDFLSSYTVGVNISPSDFVFGGNIIAAAPWRLSTSGAYENVKFYQTAAQEAETPFKRSCTVVPVEADGAGVGAGSGADSGAILVTCTTKWEEYSREREVSLSTILTDWVHE